MSRQCKWCTTNIRPVLLVSHPKPSKMRGLKAQLEATLRIPVRVRPDPTPSICLVRGFDSVPVSFAMSEKHSSDGMALRWHLWDPASICSTFSSWE